MDPINKNALHFVFLKYGLIKRFVFYAGDVNLFEMFRSKFENLARKKVGRD